MTPGTVALTLGAAILVNIFISPTFLPFRGPAP